MDKTHPMEEFHNFPWDALAIAIERKMHGLQDSHKDVEPMPVRYWLHVFAEEPSIEIGYRDHNERWVVPDSLTEVLKEMHKQGAKLQRDNVLRALGGSIV